MIESKDKNGNPVPVNSDLVTEITVSLGRSFNLPKINPKDKYEKQEAENYHVSFKLNRYPGQVPQGVVAVGNQLVDAAIEERAITFYDKCPTVVEDEPLPPIQSMGNRPSNNELPSEEHRMWLTSYILKYVAADKQEEAKKKLQGCTKAQAIDWIKACQKKIESLTE